MWAVLVAAGLLGCAAKQATNEAASVQLVTDKPEASCKALGEAAGSQGNWATGGYTSNKNLIVGARNDLRNQAASMGGNVVYVQDQSNHAASRGNGTTASTVIGTVYRCP